MKDFVEKKAFWSFFVMVISNFLSTKIAVIPFKTYSYISTIIADMKTRASYNSLSRITLTVIL